jgi:hypothetical protein
MLSELKPQSKQLVYDLVTEAGVDTNDWSKYERAESPASNPKYCYDWAFWDDNKRTVVLCLWFSQMRKSGDSIHQDLNYRKLANASGHRDPSIGVRAKRARRMDMAIQLAAKRGLPVRVIVVDGTRRGEDGADASAVERRMLDPVIWHVSSYEDDTGACRVVRGGTAAELDLAESGVIDGSHRLARIAYNSAGWQHPTGEAGDHESGETYNAKNKFGHEDWLFRAEWVIDGWRYAFIQGLNKHRQAYIGQSLDVSLYTLQPDKRRRLVATIYGLESLSDDQAKDALAVFKTRGWLKTMQDDVKKIGGNTDALGDPKWAEHVLNVRFRRENVEFHPPETLLPDDDWIHDRHRYLLYKFEETDRKRVEKSTSGRAGSQELPEVRRLFRRGTKPIEYTPEHGKMQAKLMAELTAQYGASHVLREQDFVDVRVETDQELIYFEIKTDLDPRAVIRQALGQVLEYAYHPVRTGRRPTSLVIVGRTELNSDDEAYVQALCNEFHLPLSYRVVTIY